MEVGKGDNALRRSVLIGATVLAIATPILPGKPAAAATPSGSTLSFATPVITWSNTMMTGTAPAARRITCNVPETCDDTVLTIDGGGFADAFADIAITPSPGAQMVLVYYAPGCTVSPT